MNWVVLIFCEFWVHLNFPEFWGPVKELGGIGFAWSF